MSPSGRHLAAARGYSEVSAGTGVHLEVTQRCGAARHAWSRMPAEACLFFALIYARAGDDSSTGFMTVYEQIRVRYGIPARECCSLYGREKALARGGIFPCKQRDGLAFSFETEMPRLIKILQTPFLPFTLLSIFQLKAVMTLRLNLALL